LVTLLWLKIQRISQKIIEAEVNACCMDILMFMICSECLRELKERLRYYYIVSHKLR